MQKGLYTAALGMTAQMQRMDVITNNLSNSDTTGFKRDLPVTQSFTEILESRLHDPGNTMFLHDVAIGDASLGVFVDDVWTDFGQGSLRETGGALDFSISGAGFFTVATPNGDMYTRDGAFTLDTANTLVTKDGYSVLGANGEAIVIPDGDVTVDTLGNISVNGLRVNTFALADFANPESLRKQGANLYAQTADTQVAGFVSPVVQGYLENSNANAVKEMVDMISLQRVYEANQRVIQTYDNSLNRAVNDIARK